MRVALLFALAVATVPAAAFCGLQSCPRPAGSGETPRVEAALRTRWVSYAIDGNEGSYLVTAPRLFFSRYGFAAGAEIPFTRLDNGTEIVTGLSNPILMARYARRLSYAWSAEVGLQWELPLGDEADGLAGDHHMLLPWIGARFDIGHAWYIAGQVGYSKAIESSAASEDTTTALAKVAHAGHDEAHPVLVNPHADQELQSRAAVGWSHGRGTLEVFALTQSDRTSDATGTYARLGASYERTIARFTALQLIGDLPVTSNRRNDAEIGLTFKTGF